VREAPFAIDKFEDRGIGALGKPAFELRAGRRKLFNHSVIDAAASDRGDAQQADGIRRKAVDTALEHGAHTTRHHYARQSYFTNLIEVAGHPCERAQHLNYEEDIAFGLAFEQREDILAIAERTENRAAQFRDRILAEPLKLEQPGLRH